MPQLQSLKGKLLVAIIGLVVGSGLIISFRGVHFKAETAAIANPGKRVLIPEPKAGCSLADTIQARDVARCREQHPDGLVVAYVNTSAEVKAQADYCCTSGNAVAVVRALPPDVPVLFLPDFFLGNYVREVTGRQLDVWLGECHVHAGLRPAMLEARKQELPDAEFLVHPECGCTMSMMYYVHRDQGGNGNGPGQGLVKIVSTDQMMQRARESTARRFVVGTENGVLHRMRKENPGKEFFPASEDAEWGDPARREDWECMASYSPYDAIAPRRYPHVFAPRRSTTPRCRTGSRPSGWRACATTTSATATSCSTPTSSRHSNASAQADDDFSSG